MNLTVTVMYRWFANGENLRKRYDNGDTWYEFGMGAQVQLSRNTISMVILNAALAATRKRNGR